MKLKVERYLSQVANWPGEGRHILAQFDDETVVVYQAYRPAIGHFAAKHGYFGGEFKLTRMSWIKTNFLWMMYRSGWGTKDGQEVVLAVRVQRSAFDLILSRAVPSTFQRKLHADHAAWKKAVSDSDVRLQFDPDHDPQGHPVGRRAIQLGLRGGTLAKYARDWVVGIEDVSDFVKDQQRHVKSGNLAERLTPRERTYPVEKEEIRFRLGLS